MPPWQVGVLICADAYTPGMARHLHAQGAQCLVSAASWGPAPHGPEGAWERCSQKTGPPLVVCNRTGREHTLSFLDAESVVVQDGWRLVSLQAPHSAFLMLDWDVQTLGLVTPGYQHLELCRDTGGNWQREYISTLLYKSHRCISTQRSTQIA